MYLDSIDVIVLFITSMMILLVIVIWRKSTRLKAEIFEFIAGFLFIAIGNILSIFNQLSYNIGLFLQGIGMIFIFFHYQTFQNNSPNFILSTLLIGILISFLALNGLIWISDYDSVINFLYNDFLIDRQIN